MIIAIDGPAGSGKGTIARLLAEKLTLAYLDTGLLYRVVAKKCLAQGLDINTTHGIVEESEVVKVAEGICNDDLTADGLRTAGIAAAASKIAAFAAVREELVGFQRRFAAHPLAGFNGAVLDGRDIGTVICPDADYKFYLTATPEVRAARRCKELPGSSVQDVLRDIVERDLRDSTRAVAPLKPAEDAVVVDTSNKTVEAVLAEVLGVIKA